MNIGLILGTRPEIIKFYSILLKLNRRDSKYFVVHTNQHYDERMDRVFFKELGLKQPEYNIGVGSGSHAQQTARMMIGIEDVFKKERPDIVFVQGDTNTVLAGALTASKMGIKIGHVEAGLRSYDRTMPEEINRLLTDHLSDYLFCPTKKQADILLGEGIDFNKIYVTGNTIVDAVSFGIERAERGSKVLERFEVQKEEYFLLTCHRPSNTDIEMNFLSILKAVSDISRKEGVKCIFPMHPRLKAKESLVKGFPEIIVSEPVGYLDLLMLQKQSKMIFTDSGGIQEEACILRKKCVILRKNTERPETLEVGGAVVLNEISKEEIISAYHALDQREVEWENPFGDGKAYERILDIIV